MAGRQKRSFRLERENWRLGSKTTAKILLVLVGFGVLSWLSLAQTSKVYSARYNILKKQAQQASLQRQNAELAAEIMEMLEVSELGERALGSGYVFADRVRYLNVPGYAPASMDLRRSGAGSASEKGMVVGWEKKTPTPQEEVGQDDNLSHGVSGWWNRLMSQFEDWVGE